MSREQILNAVLKSQPQATALPADLQFDSPTREAITEKFIQMITLIGGRVIPIQQIEDINLYAAEHFKVTDRKITPIEALDFYVPFTGEEDPHEFADTEFAVFATHFAVAENGAVWITEDKMGHRVLPFITQNLAMLVDESEIVATMHDAYQKMPDNDYGFGTFIAGPSKTADIEQSLVLGAHGARTMTIFLLKKALNF
ncbi:LutC/YkgG family protein [Pedobacter sp. MW01-1-1]|uniref:LutC/YkgG family protein n=1 Tax=Pedobacter sp. MW01-1-1 TaxID=3383027 RepID=UPI003FF0DEBF